MAERNKNRFSYGRMEENFLRQIDWLVEHVGLPKHAFLKGFVRRFHLYKQIHEYCSPCKLLDVAVGYGDVALALQDDGFEVYTTDSSIISDVAFKIMELRKIPCYDIFAETDPLPLEDNTFDVVRFSATIEHIHNSPKHVLTEIRRVLKPGGLFFIDTPNFIELRHRVYMLLGISNLPSIEYVYNSEFNAEHHREYTRQELEQVLLWSGFEIVKSQLVDTFFPLSLKNFKGLGRGRAPEVKSEFGVGFDYTNLYDYAKLPLQLLVKIFPGLRETIAIVARK